LIQCNRGQWVQWDQYYQWNQLRNNIVWGVVEDKQDMLNNNMGLFDMDNWDNMTFYPKHRD
jgi:hypothetical protein